MSDIFISYKREDQPIARKLADALGRESWSVWWDPKLRAGEHFDDVIENALKEAKCVVVMWSNLSVNSRYVRTEATYALDQDKLVPVSIENVDLPLRFRGVHTLSLVGWDGSKDFSEFRKLVDDISAILGQSPTATAAAEEQRRREAEQRRKVEEEHLGEEERERLQEPTAPPPPRNNKKVVHLGTIVDDLEAPTWQRKKQESKETEKLTLNNSTFHTKAGSRASPQRLNTERRRRLSQEQKRQSAEAERDAQEEEQTPITEKQNRAAQDGESLSSEAEIQRNVGAERLVEEQRQKRQAEEPSRAERQAQAADAVGVQAEAKLRNYNPPNLDAVRPVVFTALVILSVTAILAAIRSCIP